MTSVSCGSALRACLIPLLLSTLVCAAAHATPGQGEVLPELAVDDCGEMSVSGKEIRYEPWSHAGKPLLLHFIAARPGMDGANSEVVRKVLNARPALRPLTITLVNQRDAVWGTGSIVKGVVEGRKRELPHARMVLDCQGKVGESWSLPQGTSVLMLLDADAKVLFVQLGKTPAERVPALLTAVDALGLPETPDVSAR